MINLSNTDARRLALAQQGLLSAKPQFGKGKKAVLRAIEHLGYVQIDAISVIQRAHHHTLWSRIPGYQPKHLNNLLSKDRSIFEYWSHAAAFLPMKDYPLSLPVMQFISAKAKHWYRVDSDFKKQVLQRIKIEGPLYARDFETPKNDSPGMWNWKPAKRALHELFMEGAVAVSSRDGFQRLYDLPERVIPAKYHTHTPTNTLDDYIWYRCLQAIKAHGLVTIPELRYQRHISTSQVQSVLEKLQSDGLVTPLKVERSRFNYFTAPELLQNIPTRTVKQLHFLSPFDNAVIQRKRIHELFNFDYQTEIYYPAEKRKYGYFSLPILYGTEFIGRMDPKAHRKQKILEIKNLELEPRVKVDHRLLGHLKNKLYQFCHFNECTAYSITRANPSLLKSALL